MELSRLKKVEFMYLIFVIGCIIGWIYEEFFYYFEDGYFVNRGFLYGPWLPIYGFGAVMMALTLKKVKRWPPLVFIFSMLLTGVWELIVGACIMEFWHARMWDYTGLFMNIGGYVCLRSVLTFAIGGIGLIYFIEPFMRRHIPQLKDKTVHIIAGSFLAAMLIDLVCSILIP